MDNANENGPGLHTGAGNHDAGCISNSGVMNTIITAQAQFLMAAHYVRPELAVALSAIVFGGGAHG